jgi:hypothetical protein
VSARPMSLIDRRTDVDRVRLRIELSHRAVALPLALLRDTRFDRTPAPLTTGLPKHDTFWRDLLCGAPATGLWDWPPPASNSRFRDSAAA